MAIVSSDERDGYGLHATWMHSLGEEPKFEVEVFTPTGEDLGSWIVSGVECTPETAMDMAFEQAVGVDHDA